MLVNESQRLLDEVITKLSWTNEFISNASKYERCSYAENHWIPTKSIHKHNNYCSLRQQGYLKDEINSMVPSADVCVSEYPQPTSDWTNDPSWIMNMEAFFTDKSHRSSNTASQDASKLEVLSMMRDAKRRRQSYRGIHTARKSYTEVLREIIAQQTEILSSTQESMKRSSDKRSSVESFRIEQEAVKRKSDSYKCNLTNYSQLNNPPGDSRHGNERYSRPTSKHKYDSPKRDIKRSVSKRHTSSSYHHSCNDDDDVDIVGSVDLSKHERPKKHKKHSKQKHKHKHKHRSK
ncbi:unnamed protein product [Heterobilharzia americana]|nr:unnamed protein product [Heterobilharzia americana]